ncbi:CGNR zinc finger domain-containing protein [Actinomycetospora sp. TBRC 11914]|nr:CGNR zinc finger domain-containing protein [Actinomycetospora sp. TBRC 11914]
MNTVWADRQGVHDTLDDPEQARAWFGGAARGLGRPDGTVDDEALRRLRALRDALRCLAAEATADDRPTWTSPVTDADQAVAVVNDAASAAPTWSALERDEGGALVRVTRSHGSAALAVVAAVAEQAVDLLAGSADLRACRAPGCVLYFVRQHARREWCSAGCGNRARVARHYRRHHGGQFE